MSFAIFIAETVVQQRFATSIPQAFNAPILSWIYKADVVKGYSFHSSPTPMITSISKGSIPVFFKAFKAALTPISWVPSFSPGIDFFTIPNFSMTACSAQTPFVFSAISFAVIHWSGIYIPVPTMPTLGLFILSRLSI